jgi:hypothetical protein
MSNKKGITHILSLHDVKKAGLSAREFMTEQLKGLYSNEFLDGLNDDQIYDLFDEMIQQPGLQHIKLQKPVKPRPDSNIYDLPIEDEWWLIKPEKPDPEEV